MDSAPYVGRLSPGVRCDLLRVLTSPSNVRADVIRQFHERGDADMVDVLAQLEENELFRLQVVAALKDPNLGGRHA